MDTATEPLDALIRSGARRLTGFRRRAFLAEVATAVCDGSPRQAERRFGWGRDTVATGLHEAQQGMRCLENFAARGRRRSEDKDPQLAADIRAIVEPHTYADPELKSQRRYTNLSAAEVRDALIAKGYSPTELPSERTMRDILNRMNYRLKRIQKGKPLKKTEETDAIFANVAAVRQQARDDPETLEISMDAKAKVARGDYVRGEKTRTDSTGEVPKGWDHDPPAKQKLTPYGILTVASGALMLLFGSHDTSDAWVDALRMWWLEVGPGLGSIKRLVIDLDNGPKNSGRRTQFLKRMVEFADWSGLEIRLVYYPPYHSKYNPIERCWSALEKKWNGVLLNCWKVVLQCALRMRWKGRHPTVKRLHGTYPDGIRVSAKEMKPIEARLQRSATLPKYDITIKPKATEPQVM
jgi:Rhodopirellula transposase DDE domain